MTVSAVAADAPPKKTAEEPGTHVQMPFLIAPVSVDGKLQGYVYITSKLIAATPTASVEIRDKLAFIQDAFVRDVNAKDVASGPDVSTVDKAALTARLVGDAKRIVGAPKVVSIVFTEMQFSPLHPKTTTTDQNTGAAPSPPPPAAKPPAASSTKP
ncbi:MAG: hypothetical protein WDM89_16605 [Rhizomicrobium sp.]